LVAIIVFVNPSLLVANAVAAVESSVKVVVLLVRLVQVRSAVLEIVVGVSTELFSLATTSNAMSWESVRPLRLRVTTSEEVLIDVVGQVVCVTDITDIHRLLRSSMI
jgi:hypothetical protein